VWDYARPFSLLSQRAVASGIVIAALLTPFFSGLILFAQGEGRNCNMACCKHAKDSCTHRSRQEDDAINPLWANSQECPTGCGQKIAPPPPPITTLAADRCDFGQTTTVSFLQPATLPPYSSGQAEFALFGRPPPSYPLSHT
jgi:hypothetical protein